MQMRLIILVVIRQDITMAIGIIRRTIDFHPIELWTIIIQLVNINLKRRRPFHDDLTNHQANIKLITKVEFRPKKIKQIRFETCFFFHLESTRPEHDRRANGFASHHSSSDSSSTHSTTNLTSTSADLSNLGSTQSYSSHSNSYNRWTFIDKEKIRFCLLALFLPNKLKKGSSERINWRDAWKFFFFPLFIFVYNLWKKSFVLFLLYLHLMLFYFSSSIRLVFP